MKKNVDVELRNVNVTVTAVERDVIAGLFENSRSLENYAENGSTDAELAVIFGVPEAALVPFEALLAKARAELNYRIRRAQLAAGDKGSPDALAYLTAKYLEGAEKRGAVT